MERNTCRHRSLHFPTAAQVPQSALRHDKVSLVYAKHIMPYEMRKMRRHLYDSNNNLTNLTHGRLSTN